jgi:predicted amidophosphoribosyltransferase
VLTVRAILAAAGGVLMVAYVILAGRRALERRRRWRQDLCRDCGYDLRGSRERCPECGARIVRDPRDASTMTIKDERR